MLVAGKKRRRGRAEHEREGAIEDRVGVAGCHTECLCDYVGGGRLPWEFLSDAAR